MARFDGEKSYYYAFVKPYGIENRSTTLQNQIDASRSVKILPFSFNNSGSFDITKSNPSYSNNYGFHWVSLITSKEESRRLYYAKAYLHTTGGTPTAKGYGYSLRCVAKLPLLFLKKARNFSPTNFLCYNKFIRKGH